VVEWQNTPGPNNLSSQRPAVGEVAMIASIEMLKHQDRSRSEYASRFLRSTGDTGRLQAMLAGRLPAGEVLRLALHERELRLRNGESPS